MFDREPISHTGITDNYQFECQDSDFEFVGQGCHFPIGIWIKGWTVARILEIVTIHMQYGPKCPNGPRWSRMVQTVQNGPNGPKWSKRSKMVQNGPNGPKKPKV